MAATNNLVMTLVESAQAQKEITVNEALARIDALMNRGVETRSLSTPPGSPAAGAMYIIATSPTGDWSGRAGQIAWFDQVWRFLTANDVMRIFVKDEGRCVGFAGGGWLSEDMLHRRLHSIGNSDSAVVVNPYNGEVQQIRLTASPVSITFGSVPSGRVTELMLTLQQNSSGNKLVNWGSNIRWPLSTPPVLSTSGNTVDSLSFITWDGGANWYGRMLGKGYFT